MYNYYRGSSSYEDAVKQRLEALEATGVANTNAIQDMATGIIGSVRENTYALVASQVILAQTFAQGFNELNNTLNLGFGMVGNKMDVMTNRICSKLDEIHDIVKNPLLTQSRELFQRALDNYRRGYFEEALEDCKAAVEKNKTDFISWNLLGQIYLFGAGKFSNVIDVDKAEEAFFNAAKYIDSDIGHSEEANQLASAIYYYLGYTKLIKSNDYLIENKTTESNTKLIEAEKSSSEAYRLSDKNLLAGYEQAKELHFLEKDEEALSILERLIRTDKTFALKASNDKNFESLWEQIDKLIERLRDEMVNKITEHCNRIIASGEEQNKKINELREKLRAIELPSEEEAISFDFFYRNTSGMNGYQKENYQNLELFNSIGCKLAQEKYGESYSSFAVAVVPKLLKEQYDEKRNLFGILNQMTENIESILSEFVSLKDSIKEKDYFFVSEKYSKNWQTPECFSDSLTDVIIRLRELRIESEKINVCLAARTEYEKTPKSQIAKPQEKTTSTSKGSPIIFIIIAIAAFFLVRGCMSCISF